MSGSCVRSAAAWKSFSAPVYEVIVTIAWKLPGVESHVIVLSLLYVKCRIWRMSGSSVKSAAAWTSA